MSSREEKLSFARERKIHTFFYYALNCQIDKKLELKKHQQRSYSSTDEFNLFKLYER